MFHHGNNYMQKNVDYLEEWMNRVERDLGITLDEVYAWLCQHADTYTEIYGKSIIATGYVVQSYDIRSFYERIRSRRRLIAKRI